MSTLLYNNTKPGPVRVTIQTASGQREEIVERRHGTFRMVADDAGRILLYSPRPVLTKPLGSVEWDLVLTVQRERGNPQLYSIADPATNERITRMAPNGRQIILDILDREEQEFIGTLLGI